MLYTTEVETSQIGSLELKSDGASLVCCRFEHDRYGDCGLDEECCRKDDLPLFACVRDWLGRYFAGERPDAGELPLAPRGTAFQQRVWKVLEQIPYGQTVTYGEVAARIADQTGKGTSARAVGGAVGRNPICIIVPCHRVVGAKGDLTGFGGGLATKVKLLEHERVDMGSLHMPRKVAAWDTSC